MGRVKGKLGAAASARIVDAMTQALIGLSGLGGIGCLIMGIALWMARNETQNLTLICRNRAIEITTLKADLDLARAAGQNACRRLEAVIAAKEVALAEALADLQDCTTPSAIRARLNRLLGNA